VKASISRIGSVVAWSWLVYPFQTLMTW
jgi:hypothetical protein